MISDGLSEQNRLAALQRQIANRPAGARILCVGVGNDVNRALLQRLADETTGLAAFISADDDFGRQAQSLRRKLRQPALTDVSVQIDGVRVRDLEPAKIASLYEGAAARICGRYTGSGNAQVTLKGKLNNGDYSQTFNVQFPEEADAAPELAHVGLAADQPVAERFAHQRQRHRPDHSPGPAIQHRQRVHLVHRA